MRLLDRIGVLEPLGDGHLGRARVHDPGRQDREVAVPGDADPFEAGVPRLAGSPQAIAQAALIAAVDDVDHGQEDLGVQDGLPIPTDSASSRAAPASRRAAGRSEAK